MSFIRQIYLIHSHNLCLSLSLKKKHCYVNVIHMHKFAVCIYLLSVLDLFLCLLTIAISFCALMLHSGFVPSVLNVIHVLDLESVCFDSKCLYYILCLTCSISYILLLWIRGM